MKEIGDLLKQARLEKNLSLEEINNETKIRLEYLEAIENGDFPKLPGEVYAKGFIMNFARVVGLNGQDLLRRYHDLTRPAEPAAHSDLEDDQDLQVTEETKHKQRSNSNPLTMVPYLMPIIAGLVVVSLIMLGIYTFYRNSPKSPALLEEEPSFLPSQTQGETMAQKEETLVSKKPESSREETSQSGTGSQTEMKPPVLKVTATAVTWIGLYEKESGRALFEGTLRPAESRVWTITNPVQMRIGNAGGISLHFQGKDLGNLGRHGEVKTMEFTPDIKRKSAQ